MADNADLPTDTPDTSDVIVFPKTVALMASSPQDKSVDQHTTKNTLTPQHGNSPATSAGAVGEDTNEPTTAVEVGKAIEKPTAVPNKRNVITLEQIRKIPKFARFIDAKREFDKTHPQQQSRFDEAMAKRDLSILDLPKPAYSRGQFFMDFFAEDTARYRERKAARENKKRQEARGKQTE